MSLLPDGRTIRCDGECCNKTVPAPVSTRHAVLSRGWFFQTGEGSDRHLCPECFAQYKNKVKAKNSSSSITLSSTALNNKALSNKDRQTS